MPAGYNDPCGSGGRDWIPETGYGSQPQLGQIHEFPNHYSLIIVEDVRAALMYGASHIVANLHGPAPSHFPFPASPISEAFEPSPPKAKSIDFRSRDANLLKRIAKSWGWSDNPQASGRRLIMTGPKLQSNSPALRIRRMTHADIPSAMRLKDIAGWNQVPTDWENLMRLDPGGCIVGEMGKLVVATATGISYKGQLAWVGMILVDPAHRRRGYATEMMNQTLAYLEGIGCSCLKLDATEAGAQVYARMGFRTEYQVERWTRPPGPPGREAGTIVQTLDGRVLENLGDRDVEVFGADRSHLLRLYLETASPSLYVGLPQKPDGFLLSRLGSKAFHIGPLVAETATVAGDLMAEALKSYSDHGVITDILTPNREAASLVEEMGFSRSRILQRMYRGENLFPGLPQKVFCLAGFEYG